MDQPRPLSTAQRRVLEAIQDYEDKNGTAPTMREVAEALGLKSVSSVHQHVRALEAKGWLEMTGGRQGLRLIHRLPPVGPLAGERVEKQAAQFISLREEPDGWMVTVGVTPLRASASHSVVRFAERSKAEKYATAMRTAIAKILAIMGYTAAHNARTADPRGFEDEGDVAFYSICKTFGLDHDRGLENVGYEEKRVLDALVELVDLGDGEPQVETVAEFLRLEVDECAEPLRELARKGRVVMMPDGKVRATTPQEVRAHKRAAGMYPYG